MYMSSSSVKYRQFELPGTAMPEDHLQISIRQVDVQSTPGFVTETFVSSCAGLTWLLVVILRTTVILRAARTGESN